MDPLKWKKFLIYKTHENNLNKSVFVHINILEKDLFYNEFFKFFFDEDIFYSYFENKKNITFIRNKKNFINALKKLKLFIKEEIELDKEGDDFFGKDKIGKIGEYILSIILKEHYKHSIIIPKLKLITNKNMNVYGIDAVFYNKNEKTLIFGESKITMNINSGINKINISLDGVEESIKSEYDLWSTKKEFMDNDFFETFDEIDNYMSFEEFIENVDVKKIILPLFIGHGNESEITNLEEEINNLFNEMNKIKNINNIFNKDVEIEIISLPIIDKYDFLKHITNKIGERIKEYEEKASIKR